MSPEQARGDSRRDRPAHRRLLARRRSSTSSLSGPLPYERDGVSVVQAHPRYLRGAAAARSCTGGAASTPTSRRSSRKALEKEPDRRYASAAALAEDVERYLDDQPILARPPSTIYQLGKLVARHRGKVAAAGAIAVLLVALAVTMAVQAGRVRRERDRATAEAAKASAINSFLLDALGAADPWSKGSRNVSLLDALRQAQDKAKTSFVNQPLVEASVLQTIGTTFSNLAEYPEAEKALKASLDLRGKAAGAKSAEATESLSALSEMVLGVAEVRRGREVRSRGARDHARGSRRRERRGGGGHVQPCHRANRVRKAQGRTGHGRGDAEDRARARRRGTGGGRTNQDRESRERRAPHPAPGLPRRGGLREDPRPRSRAADALEEEGRGPPPGGWRRP